MNDATTAEAKCRLLIVDDERINLIALTGLLRAEFELLVATDGAQALRLANEQRPDLILLDVVMPGMDGYEVCRRLKADPATQGIPVIFITARSETDDETRGFNLGAVDYIAKPFNERVVMARVHTHARLKRQTDLIERLVLLDGLTGIPNRRAFDQACEREWQRCRRAGAPLSVLMMDVDLFKQYNDHYGHGLGDTCLTRVGQALAASARRPGDFVGRYGGEEFVALLADTDADAALQQAEHFLAAVAALRIPHALSRVGPVVSISIGLATTIPTGEALHGLQQAADRALYQAKAAGRNRATVASAMAD